jgi:hypothetical protein
MAKTVIFAFMLGAMIVSILATLLIHFAIIEGINSRLPERSRISYFNRDLSTIFSSHRQLYPHSRLRQLMMMSIALEVALVFGFLSLSLS